jgi:uncharacterized phage protein (TIGR02220 family)
MNDFGWIKLHRKIKDHWIFEDPVKFQWWIKILLYVSHSDSKVNIKNQLIDVKRGQSVRSLSSWAEILKTSKDKVRNFFKLLENDNMILHENLTISTRLTVCNYESYQVGLHANQTQSKRNSYTDKNYKNNKEYIGVLKTPDLDVKYSYFIDSIFNKITGRKFKGCKKTKKQFEQLLQNGYSSNDFESALKNAVADKFHIESNYKYLTPELFTRQEKFERFLNMETESNLPKRLKTYSLEEIRKMYE